MREVLKEIRQLILEEEEMIEVYHKAKNKEMEQYHNGVRFGLMKSVGVIMIELNRLRKN